MKLWLLAVVVVVLAEGLIANANANSNLAMSPQELRCAGCAFAAEQSAALIVNKLLHIMATTPAGAEQAVNLREASVMSLACTEYGDPDWDVKHTDVALTRACQNFTSDRSGGELETYRAMLDAIKDSTEEFGAKFALSRHVFDGACAEDACANVRHPVALIHELGKLKSLTKNCFVCQYAYLRLFIAGLKVARRDPSYTRIALNDALDDVCSDMRLHTLDDQYKAVESRCVDFTDDFGEVTLQVVKKVLSGRVQLEDGLHELCATETEYCRPRHLIAYHAEKEVEDVVNAMRGEEREEL
jgi:hypothetical protein